MQLIIPHHLWEKILSHAKGEAPKECCGYLLGRMEGESNVVEEVFAMQNTHPQPKEHFSFSSKEQLKVLREYSHLQIIGIYHSHPSSDPIPSQEDEEYMYFQTYSNLIISLKNGITFASYRKIKQEVLNEEVVLNTL